MKDLTETINIDFQQLLETEPVCYVILSPDFSIVGASNAMLEKAGTKKQLVTGKSLPEAFDFYKDVYSAASGGVSVLESIQQASVTGQVQEMPVLKLDIKNTSNHRCESYWKISHIPVTFAQKQLLCIIHKVEDVTELELARREAAHYFQLKSELEATDDMRIRKLKESEVRFMKLFDLCPAPVFLMKVADFQLVMVNDAFCNLLQAEKTLFSSKSLIELGFVELSDFEAFLGKLNHPGDEGQDIELSIKMASGEFRRYSVTFEITQFGDSLCYLVVMHDITNRIKAEEHLLSSNKFLDTVLDNLPGIVFVKNAADLQFVYLNKAGEDFFGVTLADLKGKNCFNFYTDEQAAKILEEEQNLFKDNCVTEFEEGPLRTLDGEKWLQTKKIPVFENNTPAFVVCISQDISEKKKQQDAILSLNKELEAFSYSVSHDLRAPLRAVTGYAQMLREDYSDILDAEGNRLLRTISENAEKMGKLIDNLLTFSRLGRKELSLRDTDMNELMQQVMREINRTTPHKAKITVANLQSVKSDPDLLARVMFNLIENAIKYSSKKANPLVEINSYTADGQVVFCIADNGAGFNMKYYDKLFGVFQRLHAVDEFDGSGVGLAIVQRIVSKHGGRVWAKSKLDEGATFCVALPAN